MFCNQCEQAAQGTGCTAVGVCGKQPEVAALQDLLVFALKGIGFWADKARAAGKSDIEIDRFVIEGLFTTVTNVDFDPANIEKILQKSAVIRDKAQALAGPVSGTIPAAASWKPAADSAGLQAQGEAHGIHDEKVDADIESIRQVILYGLKGYAAYADHALILGRESDEVYAFTHKALAASLDESLGLMDYVGMAMETGRINLVTMELLSVAHTDTYGHPVPTPVNLGTKAGKAILVTGHDLKMLQEQLKRKRL